MSSANELLEWNLTGPFRDPDGSLWYILLMIDMFTRWVEAAPLIDTASRKRISALHESWVTRYGVPCQLHNEEGANLCSREVVEHCDRLGIHHSRTAPYHPQGNGASSGCIEP